MPLPKPGSYAELLAHVNASSFLLPSGYEPKEAKPRNKKLDKLFAAVEKMSDAQRAVLLELVRGERFLIAAKGERFGCKRTAVGFGVHGFEADSTEHTVTVDGSACSCPQNRISNRTCKHMRAVCSFLQN